jgi:predicted amidophosphoribosyltransferase
LPKGVRAVAAPWAYEGPARALILTLKVRGLQAAAAPVLEGMIAASRRVGFTGSAVTWVPGHRADIRRRGFDHAEILARGVARQLGLRALPLLQRRRETVDQTSLSARGRALNVRGAFEAARRPSEVVILVDDLITTGATAGACAQVLRAAGARAVEVLVACRA